MRDTLPLALKLMFGDEGGYSNRKTDAGGPTKYGITQKTLAAWRGHPVSPDDVQHLLLDEAAKIYRANYWAQSGADLLPRGLDYAAFDFGVNSGPATAVRKLQAMVGAVPDGNVGVQTLDAVRAYGPLDTVIRDYVELRMKYLRSLKGRQGWAANGRGWTIRVTGKDPNGQWASKPGVLGNALALAASNISEPELPPTVPQKPRTVEDRETIDAMAAKAPQPAPREATSPEVLATGATAAGGVLAALQGLSGPIAWAVAGVLVAGFAVAAFYMIRRIRAQPA